MPSSSDRLLLPPWAVAAGLAALAAAGWGWYRLAQPTPRLADVAPELAPTGVIPVGEPLRSGVPATIAAEAPEARGACTWLLRNPDLGAVSDKGLMDATGFLDASPLRVWRGDVALTMHDRSGDCDGGAAHGPLGVFVRPADGVVDGAWSVRWSDEVLTHPRRGPRGPQPLLWAVPGTTLDIPVTAAWSPRWGEPVVRLAGVATRASSPATLAWGDTTVSVTGVGGAFRAELRAPLPREPSTITLRVPADGPALAITDLVVGDGPAAHAVVGSVEGVTTPLAGAGSAALGPVAVVTRAGTPPRAPVSLGEPDGACRVVLKRPDLEPLSDLRLFERYGWISASPVAVLEDGQPLTAHDRGEGCAGAFSHPPQGLVVRPRDRGQGHAYAVGWMPDVEVEVATKGQGKARLTWAVPGSTTTWTWEAPLAEGPHDVVLDLVALGGAVEARASLGEASVAVPPGAEQRIALPGPPGQGAFTLSLTVPEDGPAIVVRAIEARPRP